MQDTRAVHLFVGTKERVPGPNRYGTTTPTTNEFEILSHGPKNCVQIEM